MNYIKSSLLDLFFIIYWGPARIVMKSMPIFALYWIADMTTFIIFAFKGDHLIATCRAFCAACGLRLTQDQIEIMAREGLALSVKRNFERLIMSTLTRAKADKMVTPVGLEHIDDALSEGKGAIIQVAHFGSFLLPVAYLGLLGYTVTQISIKPEIIHSSIFAALLKRMRIKDDQRFAIDFFYLETSPKGILKRLKNNEIVAIAIDGRKAQDFVSVKFLDGKARFAPGIIRIAQISGAPIIPTFIVRQPDDTQKVIVESPFSIEHDANREKMVKENLERLAAITADYIRNYPSHFYMNFRKSSKVNINVPLFEVSDETA